MLIRDATLDDISGLIFLGEEMFKESQFAHYDFDHQKVIDTIYTLIDSSNGIVLVAESNGELVAGFAAQFSEHWFGKCIVSYDMAFFIAPQVRGSLAASQILKAYIERAKAEGVNEILIGNSTGFNSEATEQFFMLMGFTRIGGNFRLTNGTDKPAMSDKSESDD